MREGAAGPQWGRGSPGPAPRGAAGSRVEWALSGGSRRPPSGQRLCRHAAGTETPRAVGAAGGPGAAAVSTVPRRAPPGEGGVSPRSPGEESPARAEQRGAAARSSGSLPAHGAWRPVVGGAAFACTPPCDASVLDAVPVRLSRSEWACSIPPRRSPSCPCLPSWPLAWGHAAAGRASWAQAVPSRFVAGQTADPRSVLAAGPGRAGRAVCALPPHALCSLSSTILEEEKAQQEERMRMESRRQVAVSWDSGGPDEAPPKVAGAPAGVGGASTGHAKSSRCQTPLCLLLLCGALLSTCFPNLHFTCSDPRVIGFATTSNCPSWSAPPIPSTFALF